MKLKEERKADRNYDFVVALSRQAVAVVKVAMQETAGKRWLFPGIAGWRSPISDSTLSGHYRDAGFADRHVPHGWRATFSTIMNERAGIDGSDRDREVIDLMLGHMKENVEASYNRAAYLPRRRELWQEWADLLMDGLPPPETILGR
jgi:integrase